MYDKNWITFQTLAFFNMWCHSRLESIYWLILGKVALVSLGENLLLTHKKGKHLLSWGRLYYYYRYYSAKCVCSMNQNRFVCYRINITFMCFCHAFDMILKYHICMQIKVSKFQRQIFLSSIPPKNEQNHFLFFVLVSKTGQIKKMKALFIIWIKG